MRPKLNSLRILQIIVRWLKRTQGRDKLCKMIQYFCLIMRQVYKNNDYYSLQFQTLFQSIKDTRKIFRLFKSIKQYQNLIDILLDDQDNILKIFRVLGQVFFFFYWFFDNISILYKIKLFRGNFEKYNKVASIFWLLSLLVMIPVNYFQSLKAKDKKQRRKFKLDAIKYTFDLFPSTSDSKLLKKFFNIQFHPLLISLGGFTSATISTYQNIKQSSEIR